MDYAVDVYNVSYCCDERIGLRTVTKCLFCCQRSADMVIGMFNVGYHYHGSWDLCLKGCAQSIDSLPKSADVGDASGICNVCCYALESERKK